jgi:multimeric flavodoxin WrbA
MSESQTRRSLLGAAAVAGAASVGLGQATAPPEAGSIRIVGIACSPRAGKTTATAVGAALASAAQVDANIETKLIDAGALTFSGWNGAPSQTPDDFDRIVLPALRDPAVAGLIIGSPVYFRNMSSRCMAMIERLAALRQPTLLLADKPVGVLAVGGFRHGGQELVIQQIQTALLCHEAMIVGGKPPAHQGATLWNAANDDIAQDELGLKTAALLGQRVAEAAIRIAT